MRLGILGTMVWDRIDHPDGDRIERWGGISYSLAAAAAAAPAGMTLRPLIKVGHDRAEDARAFLASLPLESTDGVLVVPEPTNRVHLRYRDRHHREEVLSGGISGWTPAQLQPHLEGLDALYVNLISGFELDATTASSLRPGVDGPVYADLHSLMLDVAADGMRVPRPLDDRDAWLDAFDVIQVNEEELALLAGADVPEDFARQAVRTRGVTLLVTRGADGAEWYAAGDRTRPWEAAPDRIDRGDTVEHGRAGAPAPAPLGDPTGCGDVWGATCFIHLLRGERLSGAVEAANGAAGRNVGHRGADGLYEHLRMMT